MSILNILNLSSVLACLTISSLGCGSAPSGALTISTETAAPAATPDAQPAVTPEVDPVTPVVVSSPLPTPPVGLTTFPLTYYSAAVTVAPDSSHPSYKATLTGHCVVYNSNTYCWDDGIHVVTLPKIGGLIPVYTLTYFTLGYDSLGRFNVDGNSEYVTDPMLDPTTVDGQIKAQFTLVADVKARYNAVISGTGTNVTCFEDSGTLDCGDFTVDLNQAVLR